MNYNTDGFNDRNIYINNANDRNRLNKMGPSNIDSSFAKMKVDENKPDIKTVDTHSSIERVEEVRGSRENFVLRNNNMRNANVNPSMNNPVRNAMDKNMFKRF